MVGNYGINYVLFNCCVCVCACAVYVSVCVCTYICAHVFVSVYISDCTGVCV